MHNSKSGKIIKLFPLILCLSFQCKTVLAEELNEQDEALNNQNTKSNTNDKETPASNLPALDEAFLMFLAEVDVQNGVEIDPLDMLDVKLENSENSQELKVNSINVKQAQKIEEPKENK